MAASVHSDEGDPGFQIAPMVDVVFVLLLFFMACAGMRAYERELAVHLPSTGTGGTVPVPLFIDIDPSGRVSVNDKVFAQPGAADMSLLTDWLKSVATEYGEDPVILRPSPETKHGRIVEVLNACSAAKVKKLSFG